MSLVTGYSSSEEESVKNVSNANNESSLSSSSSSSELEEEENFKTLPLPGAIFGKKASKINNLDINQRKLSENSVFSNSFAQSEATIQQTLSKHKTLSEVSPEKNNKRHRKKIAKEEKKKLKLCMHFFKHGTCKYEEKCKFSHKLLNQQPEKPSLPVEEIQPDIIHKPELYKKSTKAKKEEEEFNVSDDGESCLIKKAKKRPGLGNDIVPGKKVLKSYDKIYK